MEAGVTGAAQLLEDIEGRVVTLKHGDLLVLTTKHMVSDNTAKHINERFTEALRSVGWPPGSVALALIDGGMKLSVLRREDQ